MNSAFFKRIYNRNQERKPKGTVKAMKLVMMRVRKPIQIKVVT